MRTMCSL